MCNSNQAARIDIITTHFNVQIFTYMDLNVLPHVIAWIGRYWDDSVVNGVLNTLLRWREMEILAMSKSAEAPVKCLCFITLSDQGQLDLCDSL